MSFEFEISDVLPDHFSRVEQLYQGAFPDEDLVPLVKDLLTGREDVLSLSALKEGELVAHAIFSMCGLAGENYGSAENLALLGPIAVSVARQKQGVGSALIRDGLKRLTESGTAQVFVLGDPAYYGRFEFRQDDLVAPPYPLPENWRPAWQSISLQPEKRALSGTLTVPEPWQDKTFWT